MLKMRHFLFVILILMTATISFGVELKIIFKWKHVDFAWDSPMQKEKAINTGKYNPNSCVLYDVDKAPGGLILFEALAN